MGAVPLTFVGIATDEGGGSKSVTLVGMASITGLGVGGGPIINPPHPEHPIVPPGGYPKPEHPIVIPEPPDTIPPEPPIGTPPDQTVVLKEPPSSGGWGFFPEFGWGYFPGGMKPGPKTNPAPTTKSTK